jgi:ABC-type glycerol-3-phosphate transport system substrate-binding protein
MDNKKLTRRDFLRTAGMAASASLLAACSTKEVIKTEIVKEIVKETQIVKEEVEVEKVVTEVVKETQIVKEEVEKIVEVTPTPLPTMPPEPIVMDVWFNTDIPDIDAEWAPDPDNTEFQKQWYFGGLGRAIFKPWLEKHPGVSMKITTHSWDSELRQNQLMSLAAGIIPDTTYGEAYVNEFVQLGVYSPLSDDVVALFADGSSAGSRVDGKTYGIPKSSGADVLFINLTLWEKAGLDRNKLPTTWEELVTACKAISAVNASDTFGNTCFYTYGPGGDSYGQAMRILHWFNQNGCPLGDNVGVPNANADKAVDTWLFHNELMWTSTENLILQGESEGGSGKLFNDGVIAVKPGWNNDATSVGDGNIDGTAIPFPIPPGGQQATIVIGNDMHSALKGGKNPDIAVTLVEESLVNPDAQAFLADNCGIWIPALKSQLEQADTYDKLAGYKTEIAQNIVRVTMKALLTGNSGPLPGWPKNGSRIWAAWNDMYGRIWKGKMGAEDIKNELDTLQTTIEGLVVKTG